MASSNRGHIDWLQQARTPEWFELDQPHPQSVWPVRSRSNVDVDYPFSFSSLRFTLGGSAAWREILPFLGRLARRLEMSNLFLHFPLTVSSSFTPWSLDCA